MLAAGISAHLDAIGGEHGESAGNESTWRVKLGGYLPSVAADWCLEKEPPPVAEQSQEEFVSMDAYLGAELPEESLDVAGQEPAQVEQTSAEYLGRWNRLVSSTNWEKGRIISLWRQALVDSEASVQAYSDEAWARRAGNVSGQHVGRLRRVFERFGQVASEYPGLFWSHFQAALDWEDAEMWLEGAMRSGWSVSQMRQQRWETIGSPPDQQPQDQDVVASEMDEDAAADEDSLPASIGESVGVVQAAEAVDEWESTAEPDAASEAAPFDESAHAADARQAVEPVRPFENLPTLPDDLAEAFEAFKLAIVNHRVSGWQETSCQAVLDALDALKQLALAPVERA